MYSVEDTAEAVGCPIRKSTDQCLLAAPHGLSQRAASFIASQCQGIHQMPFIRLFYTVECATRRRKPTRDKHRPARIRQRCIVYDPTDSFFRCRKISPVGSSSVTHSLHMSKIPYPPQRISAFSLVGYLSAGSLKVTKGHYPSLCPSSWWRRTGSNRRPHACKARALPTELRPLIRRQKPEVRNRKKASKNLLASGFCVLSSERGGPGKT